MQVLKNPDRGNQIIEIGKIKFEHQRPIKIDREEKKIIAGSAGQNEYMQALVPFEKMMKLKKNIYLKRSSALKRQES